MKKLFSCFVSLLLIINMVSPIYANETIDENENSLDEVELQQDIVNEYSLVLSKDGKTVTGYTGEPVDVVISEGVTHIADRAFSSCKTLETIVLPGSLVSIGTAAFEYCGKLQEITIPNGVKTIGGDTFFRCIGMTNVRVNATLESIPKSMFDGCETLSSVVLPSSLKSIGERAFNGCKSLLEIQLPSSLTSIGVGAFRRCENLKGIVIPEGVTSIADTAFSDCYDLANVALPSTLESIGTSAFASCDSLSSIVFPNSITNIGDSVFSNCDALISVEWPSTVKKIGMHTFYACTALKSIIIPEGITNIGSGAFYQCFSLDNIQLPSTLESIDYQAFAYCYKLSNFTIPNSVKSIGGYAFSSCNMTELVFPEGVESLGDNVIKNSNYLQGVYLPRSLKSGFPNKPSDSTMIYVFKDSDAHKYYSENNMEYSFRNGVVISDTSLNMNVGDVIDVSTYCKNDPEFTAVERLFTTSNSSVVNVDESGNLFAKDKGVAIVSVTANGVSNDVKVSVSDDELRIEDGQLVECKNQLIESVVVPDGVTVIGARVFQLFESLESVVLPNSIKRIENSAFYGCSSLKDINFPSDLEYLGSDAFFNCELLDVEVIIPRGVKTINSNTFGGCKSLEKVVIHDEVSSINSIAFADCANLTLYFGNNDVAYNYATKNQIPYVAEISKLELDVNEIDLHVGDVYQLTCVPLPSYATVDSSLTWSSSDESVVKVDQDGMLTPVRGGIGVVTVTSDKGISASCVVNVYSPVESITLNHTVYNLERKETLQLVPSFDPVNQNSALTWSSSDESIVTVDENGLVTAIRGGVAVVTLTADNGVSGSCEVYVKQKDLGVELSAYSLELSAHETHQLLARVFPADDSQTLSWRTTNPTCVKVDENGLVTAIYPGRAEIIVESSDGFIDVCEVIVTSEVTSITMNRPGASIPVGKTVQLQAVVAPYESIGSMNLTWTSSDTNKATVDENGLVTAKNTGSAIIRATSENGLYAECEIWVIGTNVTKHDHTLKLKNYILKNGEYDEATGLHYLYALKGDKEYVIWADNTGVNFEVVYADLEPEDTDYSTRLVDIGMYLPDYGISNVQSLSIIETGILSKTNKQYTYQWNGSFVSKEYIYQIDEFLIFHTPLDKQSCLDFEYTEETNKAFKQWNVMVKNAIGITMNDLGFKSYNKSSGITNVLATSIDLNKNAITLDAGEKVTLKATVSPSKAQDKKITWESSNPSVATVDSSGVVTAKDIGKTVIVAKLASGLYDYCEVSVEKQIKKIELNESSISLLEHEIFDLVATISPSDTTQSKEVIWTSGDESIATVDQNGHVVPKSLGVTTITVTASNGLTDTCTVSVEKHIDNITLDVTEINMYYGDKYKLVATISPEDTTDSKKITWTSSNKSVVTVDSSGNLTPVNVGTATITAKTVNGLTATCTVHVFLKELTASVSKASDTSLKVSWNKVSGASGYEIYRATTIDGSYKKVATITKGTTTSYTNSKLTNGTTYFYKVRPYRTYSKKKYYGEYSEIVSYAALKTPSISVTRNNYDSIKITWKAISKAEQYEIYRSLDNKTFEYVTTTADLSYVDENLLTARTYYYRVRAIKDVETQVAYSSNSSVKSANTSLVVPKLSGTGNGVDTIVVDWNSVEGADGYELYKATSQKGTYTLVGEYDTNEGYVDTVEYGKNYFYKVRGYHNNVDGTKGYSSYSSILSTSCIGIPEIKVSKASDTSLKVSWNKVSGASGYEIYRSTTIDGSYSKVATITKGTTTSYTNSKLTNGTTYYYKVRAYKTVSKVKGYGAYSEVVSYAALKTPSISVTRNNYDSIKITWKAISKAEQYEIYRSLDNKTFEYVTTTADLSYVDENLLTARTYYYRVRATKDVETQVAYSSNSKVMSANTSLVVPKLSGTGNGVDTIVVDWNSVEGADGYELYKATSQKGTYTLVGEYATNEGYVDTVEYGKNYFYKVRGYHNNVDGTKGYSSYSSILSTSCIGIPEIKVSKASDTSLKVSWNKVSGASGYEIYRSTTIDGSYKKVATITKGTTTSYTNSKLTNGTTYYYKVRAYKTVSKVNGYGAYSEVVSYAALKTPSVTATRSGYESITLTWKTIKGADQYEIYRSLDNKNFEYLTTTSAFSYYDNGLLTGRTYYYRVRATKDVETQVAYSSNSSVKSAKTTLSTPKVKVDKIVYNRLDVSWDSVAGVDTYEIYRSTSEKGTYTLVATTSENSYSDNEVEYGKTYYYKVRGYHNNVDETVAYSSYSGIVKAKVTIVSPKVSISNTDYQTLELSWDEVEGCTGYEVYRSTSSTKNFKKIASVSEGSYKDTTLNTGTTYYYQVRGYREYEEGSIKYSSYVKVSKKVALFVPSGLVVERMSGSEAKISFNTVEGASGYEVYRATSKKGTYSKVATITEPEYINSKLSSKSGYYYKVRAYRMVGKSKVYSSYTGIVYCSK